jgi:sodium/potassium-transporting ATPase subunit alpha
MSLGKNTIMTFALNVTTAPPDDNSVGNLWDQFSPLSKLITIAAVNNRAEFEGGQAGSAANERKVLGDATDSGLLRFCDKLCDVDDIRNGFAPVFSIPFNSKNKWALTATRVPGDNDKYVVMIKGAPEYVLKKCGRYYHRERELVMEEGFSEDMLEAYNSFGSLAERVIGHAFKVPFRLSFLSLLANIFCFLRATIQTSFVFAQVIPAGPVPASEDEAESMGFLDDFVFVGLLSLMDPPRVAVPAAVDQCRSAGVGVTMVTGDHPLTAEAIARKCGIITLPTRREVAAMRNVSEEEVPLDDPDIEALVVTGGMIPGFKTDEDWDVVLDKPELVFARTTPQQKLLIVANFQRRGEIVAVTGDGVNDSPALRKANIGVAMGNPDSSEVAREAADVVLLDDDFSSLVAAITEGRLLYDNLKKTIAYTLAHIPPETFPVLLNLAFGMPLGLGPLLVLSIDLLTEQVREPGSVAND